MKTNQIIVASLVGLTTCSSLVLASIHTYADNDTAVDEVEITVPVACTMTGTIDTNHTATLTPGTYSGTSTDYANGIGKTTLTTFCNDNNGFSIYAIGFTGDTEGTNTLVGANTGATIATKAYESTDTVSNWSMKVTKVTDTTQTYNPNNMTITNSYDSWHAVPDDYTKVAEYKSTTEPATTDTTLGAKIETTYATYVATNQPADTYTGKVKYVMVHPYNGTAPTIPPLGPNPPTSCNTPIAGITYMQDINSSNKATVLASLTTEQAYYVRDARDNEPYCVSKLKDGNLWMLDNLRLDLTNSTTLAKVTDQTTNASATSLGYLKGTTSRDASEDPDGNYATSAVSDWLTNPTYSESDSSSDPLIAISGDCESTYECSNDSELGKWTKDSLPPDMDEQHTYYGNGSGKIGVYYNYCAASAGSYCYGDGNSDYGEPSGNATEDICPKNWRMPTGGYGFGEYYTLYGYYNSTQDATNSNSLQHNLSTPLSGNFEYGLSIYQGSYGNFWSSSLGSNYDMYVLNVYSYGMGWGNLERSNGYSVRCIFKA